MKNYLFELKRNLSNSFLIKLIFSYSFIIIFMLALISLIISKNISSDSLQKEVNYEDQITRRVSDYFDDDINAAKSVIQKIYYLDQSTKNSFYNFLDSHDEISYDYLVDKSKIDTMFQTEVNGNVNDIVNIIFYKCNTNTVLSYSNDLRAVNSSFKEYAWFNSILKGDEVFTIVPSYYPKYMQSDDRPVYSIVAGFRNNQNQIAGILIINLDANQMERSYAEYKKNVIGSIIVTDKLGKVFYDSSKQYYNRVYPYLNKLNSNHKFVMLDRESIVSTNESKSGFITIGIIPKDKVMENIKLVENTIYLIMIICMGISIVLIFTISNLFSKKVKIVIRAMKEVENGNLMKRIPLGKGDDEIEQIYRHFNKMCELLEGYIDRMYVAEIRTKDAELSALQSQINPHFLYNTLEVIRMRAIKGNDEDVSDMIYILANLFKANVKNRDRGIKIEDEVNYAKSYLELHKIRHREWLKIVFDMSSDIMDYGILKLILQPLLENSILYGGIGERNSPLIITIKGKKEENTIFVQIIDNGTGINEDKLNSLRTSLKTISKDQRTNNDSIGLKNINDRIKIIFGEKYGLNIFSKKNQYTKVVVKIPAITVEEINEYVQSNNRR